MDRIEDEASLWAARLRSGAMTDEDRAALEAWLATSEQHRTALARYRELTVALDIGLARSPAKVAARFPRWWIAPVALAAAAAIVMGILSTSGETIATGIAERRSAALADGTRVELNARTEMIVKLKRHERDVRLVRGEALFTVAHDAARPFVVETPAGVVRVTGTVFDVRASDSARLEVTVLAGQVRVSVAGATGPAETLGTNAQGVIADERLAVLPISAAAAREVVAWREGQVIFQDTPLREALARFAAYDQRRLEVAPAAADLRLGGRYSLADVDGALESIERMLPVRIVHRPGAVVIEPANR